MRKFRFIPIVTVVATVLAGGVGAAHASAAAPGPAPVNPGGPMVRAPGIQPAVVTSINSPNWAGYAVSPTATSPGLTEVSGSWTQPKVTCSRNDALASATASFWVGLDGLNSSTVEQIGTSAQCYLDTNGKVAVTYWMWWEMFFVTNPPDTSTFIRNIKANDVISAAVSVTSTPTGDNYALSISDTTQRFGFSTVQKCPATCNHDSAEWIAEGPTDSAGNQLPLANYGSVTFTNSTFIDSNEATNTPNSRTPFLRTRIFENDGTTAFASPGSTSSDGRTFTVTWKHQ